MNWPCSFLAVLVHFFLEKGLERSVSTIAPPPMPATVSKPIPRLFSLILIFFAGPTCSCGCYCKYKSIMHFVFNLANCSGKYSLFSVSCNRRF